MSGIIAVSAAAAVTTIATVFAATLPEAQMIFSPLHETGGEYAAFYLANLVSIPGLALLTLIASATRD